jgi:hypothetical protein
MKLINRPSKCALYPSRFTRRTLQTTMGRSGIFAAKIGDAPGNIDGFLFRDVVFEIDPVKNPPFLLGNYIAQHLPVVIILRCLEKHIDIVELDVGWNIAPRRDNEVIVFCAVSEESQCFKAHMLR